jgi:hypothetical protein
LQNEADSIYRMIINYKFETPWRVVALLHYVALVYKIVPENSWYFKNILKGGEERTHKSRKLENTVINSYFKEPVELQIIIYS